MIPVPFPRSFTELGVKRFLVSNGVFYEVQRTLCLRGRQLYQEVVARNVGPCQYPLGFYYQGYCINLVSHVSSRVEAVPATLSFDMSR